MCFNINMETKPTSLLSFFLFISNILPVELERTIHDFDLQVFFPFHFLNKVRLSFASNIKNTVLGKCRKLSTYNA